MSLGIFCLPSGLWCITPPPRVSPRLQYVWLVFLAPFLLCLFWWNAMLYQTGADQEVQASLKHFRQAKCPRQPCDMNMLNACFLVRGIPWEMHIRPLLVLKQVPLWSSLLASRWIIEASIEQWVNEDTGVLANRLPPRMTGELPVSWPLGQYLQSFQHWHFEVNKPLQINIFSHTMPQIDEASQKLQIQLICSAGWAAVFAFLDATLRVKQNTHIHCVSVLQSLIPGVYPRSWIQ